MPDHEPEDTGDELLDRRGQWIAYIAGGLLGLCLALALLALVAVTLA